MLFLHRFLTDPSVVQATGPVLPSTSVKTSGSDKQKHTKKSNSSKKSALPTTSPVDAESKISSDTQPVMPSPGTQSTQPTYAEVVKHLKIVLLPVLPVLLPIILVLLPVLPVLPVLLLKFHLYQPSPLLVYRINQSGPDESDRDDKPLFGVAIPVSREEGELSESEEKREISEDMNYRETVRSVYAFMGWNFIPDFELDNRGTESSNNPWKGKNHKKTGKMSVEIPADDWLCQKIERLNCVAAEGYPSRSQDARGLKTDQFIWTPKSQSKWYRQHRPRMDGPNRPGRTVFGWTDNEAKLNSQFSHIVRLNAYSPSGPPSRPIPHETLRR